MYMYNYEYNYEAELEKAIALSLEVMVMEEEEVEEEVEEKVEEVEVENCCICLTEMKDKGVMTLDCGHTMHINCFMSLIKTASGKRCPLCRAEHGVDPVMRQPIEPIVEPIVDSEWFRRQLEQVRSRPRRPRPRPESAIDEYRVGSIARIVLGYAASRPEEELTYESIKRIVFMRKNCQEQSIKGALKKLEEKGHLSKVGTRWKCAI